MLFVCRISRTKVSAARHRVGSMFRVALMLARLSAPRRLRNNMKLVLQRSLKRLRHTQALQVRRFQLLLHRSLVSAVSLWWHGSSEGEGAAPRTSLRRFCRRFPLLWLGEGTPNQRRLLRVVLAVRNIRTALTQQSSVGVRARSEDSNASSCVQSVEPSDDKLRMLGALCNFIR